MKGDIISEDNIGGIPLIETTYTPPPAKAKAATDKTIAELLAEYRALGGTGLRFMPQPLPTVNESPAALRAAREMWDF